jgi:lysophospholipase L1-like esterase
MAEAKGDEMALTRRAVLVGAAAVPLLAAAPAREETWEERWQRELREDFAMLGRYRADNARLIAERRPVEIVFMGDSITEGWKDKRPSFFVPGRIDRGIGGQTTSQMVLRIIADVVDLKPRAVHIMAGTNDIAGNTGPMTQQMTRDNLRAMTAIARQHGIKVLLASIPPAASFPWRPGLETVTPIRQLNAWIRDFALRHDAVWIDYHQVLATAEGAMRPGLAYDGVHPSEAGYDAMAGLLEPVLARVLGTKRTRR